MAGVTLERRDSHQPFSRLLRRAMGRVRDEYERHSRPKPMSHLAAKRRLDLWTRLPLCEVLQGREQIDASSQTLRSLGLPSHHDRQKDWDSLKALYQITRACDAEAAILDAGSGARSVILNWLHLLGYTNLWACDRVAYDTSDYDRKSITFSVQDLSATKYADGQFDAIACISVVEHGVSVDSFLREMQRVLKPGGILTLSTDYWPETVDCTGVFPYGEEYGEMKVFNRAEIDELMTAAEALGFVLTGPMDFTTRERAVRWDRVDRTYTFLFAAWRKAD